MALTDSIAQAVRQAYWVEDISCVPTVLRTLGELFELEVGEQVYASCWGLNGAGLSGAQCGLVEGSLMFIGLLAHREGIGKEEMFQACADFASDFQQRFGSIDCRRLRPGGFNEDDPPHLCEGLTVDAIAFSAGFIADWFGIEPRVPEDEPTETDVA